MCTLASSQCLDVLRYRHVLSNGRSFDIFHAFGTSNEKPWKVLSRHCPALAKGCMEFIDVVGIMFSRQTHTAYVSRMYTTIYVDVFICTHSSTLYIQQYLHIWHVYIFRLYQALSYSILRYHVSYLCVSLFFWKVRDLHRLRYWLATSAYACPCNSMFIHHTNERGMQVGVPSCHGLINYFVATFRPSKGYAYFADI